MAELNNQKLQDKTIRQFNDKIKETFGSQSERSLKETRLAFQSHKLFKIRRSD